MFNKQGNQIFYSGATPTTLAATVGTLPIGRQWTNYPNWIDATDEVSDLNQLKITFTIQRDSDGVVVPGSDNIQKAATGTLTFEGEAFRLLKQWLAEDVSAPQNAVEVKLLDTSCGYYEDFVIRPRSIQWCESGICTFDIVLQQADEQLNCIKRTLISDNWQGWFPVDGKPLNGKKHPRFSYCVEQRPNGTMIALWYMMGQVLAPVASLLAILIITVINPLIFAINGIILAINTIPGVNVSLINFVSPQAVIDSFTIYFVETAGCGREHPAPLIRDYISNVCDKCGIKVDSVSAPVFFAPSVTFSTSDRGLVTEPNPYYNACYFFPQTKRGVRRFDSVNILGPSPQNTDTFWIDDNRPLLYLDMLLDQLKGPFNSEWRVKNGVLYFKRKDDYLNSNYLYDFSANGADRPKILDGICFEPNDLKYAASVKGLWATDAADMNEAGGSNGSGQMNGIANFGNTDDNPNYEGIMDKTVQFGASKFRFDGTSGDYIYDAMQQLANAAVINPMGLIALYQIQTIASEFHELDYCLVMQGELCSLPKILCWDGDSYLNAKCISGRAPGGNNAPFPLPEINPAYNNDPSTGPQPWYDRHPPDTKVLGDALVAASPSFAVYRVANTFGAPLSENNALLVNYPMYFEPYYRDTMWDRWHWIDDPKRNPVMNFNWMVKIELCCDELKHIGVLQNAQNIALGQRVKLPFGYYQDGVLREITVDYNDAATYGKTIELRGTL